MGINIGKLRDRRSGLKRSGGDNKGGFWKPGDPSVGDSLTYLLHVVAPTEEMDGIPYLQFEQYSVNVNRRNTPVVALDRRNEGLWNPLTVEHLKEKGIEPGVVCPIAEHREQGVDGALIERSDKSIERSRRQFIFFVVPIATVEDGEVVMLPESERVVRPYICGFTVWDGICEIIESEGDITNPDAAIFVKLKKTRTGKDPWNIEYRVSADSNSLRKPRKLQGPERAALDDAEASGEVNPFRLLANLTKSREDVLCLLKGEDPVERKPVEVESYDDGYEKPKRGSVKAAAVKPVAPEPSSPMGYFDEDDDDIPFSEAGGDDNPVDPSGEQDEALDEFERELMARRKRRNA